MEEQQHNEPFKEEYWEDALAVLMTEEKKAARKKRIPLFFLFGTLVIMSGIFALFISEGVGKRALLVNNELQGASLRASGTDANANVPIQDSIPVHQPVQRAIAHPILSTKKQAINTPASTSAQAIKEKTKAEQNQPTKLQTQNTVNVEERSSTPTKSSDETLTTTKTDAENEDAENIAEQSLNEINDSGLSDNFMFRSEANISVKNLLVFAPKIVRTIELNLNPHEDLPNKYKDRFRKIARLPVQSQQWMVYLGNAFAPGYGVVKGNQNFNPQAGFAFENRLANRLWVRIAAGGQQITETNKTKIFLEEKPSFGYEAVETRISADRLYLFDVPVSLIWDANPRHSFFAGVGVEGIVHTVNTISENHITMFGSTEVSKEQSNGYLAGYKSLFFNGNIGYRYRITRRSSLDFSYTNGLTNINNEGHNNQRFIVRLNWNIK